MAARDVNLIEFIKLALLYKIQIPSATHYNYFSFNPFIYKWAKIAFSDYGKKKHFENLNDEDFTNKLIQCFVDDDRDLKDFLDPLKIAELPEETHLELQQDIQVEREKVQQNKTVYHPISQPIPRSVQQETQKVEEEEQKQERGGGGGPQIPRQALEKEPQISMPRLRGGKTIQNLGSNVSRGISKGANGLLRAGGNLGGKLGGAIVQGGTKMLASGGAAAVAAVGWPVIIAVLVVIIAMPVLFLLFNLFNTSTQCPPYEPNCGSPKVASASTVTLNFFIPFRDNSVTPQDIKDQILRSWPNAQINNWDFIIEEAIRNGWNPAFVLALWIEESGAQGVASYSDALGCAPNQPTTDISVSLKCLFSNFDSYTNDQFTAFLARYSGGSAENPFSNNPNFLTNLRSWYEKLVPGGTSNIPYTPGGGKGLISCPVNSGIITNGSKEANGHCSPSYEAQYGVCAKPGDSNYRGKETAIDVVSFDKVVYVPFLTGGGNPQLWRVDEVGTPIAEFEGGGIGVGLSTEASGHTFRIRFVHLSSTTLGIGQEVQPSTIIGQYNLSANHVHITLQEDGVFKPSDLYFNLCQ